MNLCVHCTSMFDTWVEYQEHLNLEHFAAKVERSDDRYELRVYSSGRADLKPIPWAGPMDQMAKRLIVARGERRLGLQYFIGG